MTTAKRLIMPSAAALALSGCMSMSGVGGDSKYACQAPEGVTCESVSGTYANAVANNLPGQRKRAAGSARPADRTTDGAPPRPASTPLLAGLPAAGGEAPSALRAQARYLRLWIKAWEDLDGDLYDQAHVYVQIDHGRWLIDRIQRRIRDAHAPLRPPAAGPADGNGSPGDAPARPATPPAGTLKAPSELFQ
ncbi:conjugal transfer protein TraV [Pseudothauera nasutitermitis]|uniref:Conjugal transfer protein TraV n=1 Tax=Pseudothauera nasutitermitis TaxID=2565930 RepID=A0A4V3WBY4_9RHOO|nr:TraV family lipoprotein [Pseudothauera nasutitermitis]THF64939.1 conjugal transfer protein TraV [Pseudothauera nasutitermitis]